LSLKEVSSAMTPLKSTPKKKKKAIIAFYRIYFTNCDDK